MNALNDITMVLVDGVDPDKALAAITYCHRLLPVNNVRLFTFKPPTSDTGIPVSIIDKLTWHQYNDFVAFRLQPFIPTEFVLVVQTDGLITSPEKWTDQFLEFDYIGAPWPDNDTWVNLQPSLFREAYNATGRKARIGNGGFSLRSQKFMAASAQWSTCEGQGEDAFLNVFHYADMMSAGIKYPSVMMAAQFAIENPIAELGYDWPHSNGEFNIKRSFGYHGAYVHGAPRI